MIHFASQHYVLLVHWCLCHILFDYAGEKFFDLLAGRDAAAEGNCTAHRGEIGSKQLFLFFGSHAFTETVPATGNLDKVGEIFVVVLTFSFAGGGQFILKGLADELFVNRQNHHLVVSKQVLANGFTKSEAVQFAAIQAFIVHRTKLGCSLLSFAFASIHVNTRSCGHV